MGESAIEVAEEHPHHSIHNQNILKTLPITAMQ
jgi:hypothetical protein